MENAANHPEVMTICDESIDKDDLFQKFLDMLNLPEAQRPASFFKIKALLTKP